MVLLIGASYAVWRYTFTGSANTIETSKIELELLESTDEIINITNALPMSDNQGKNQDQTFNFAVTTRTASNTEIGYSLKIEKSSVDSGYTSLNDNQIKVYLTDYNNSALLNPTLISDLNSYVLYSKINTHNSTTTEIQDKYKLRVWIDQDVSVNDWNENTKLQYKFKIGVGEKQEVNTLNFVYSWSTDYVYNGDSLESIDGYTTDYTTVSEGFFLKHNIGSDNRVESSELCYEISIEDFFCLKSGGTEYNEELNDFETSIYFDENKAILLKSLGEEICSVSSGLVNCVQGYAGNIYVNYRGGVGADDGIIECFAGGQYAYCGDYEEE